MKIVVTLDTALKSTAPVSESRIGLAYKVSEFTSANVAGCSVTLP